MKTSTKTKKPATHAKAERKPGRKVEARKAPPPKSPFERDGMGVAPKE